MPQKRDPVLHRTKAQVREHSRTYQARDDVQANRNKMNQARDKMKKAGLVKKGDGKDVHHKAGYHNDRKNLAVVTEARNRGHKV